MMLASNITGLGATGNPVMIPETIEVKENIPNQGTLKKNDIKKVITVEEYVKGYFSDIPIMIEVAKCESRFRQHDKNGNVLSGVENNSDKGVMQINEYYHDFESNKLGFDIMTIEGNTAYARYLFEKEGVRPWKSSSRCWSKSDAYAKYINSELAINR